MFALALVLLAPTLRADDEQPTPPKLRLGDGARPVRYAARLRVLPTEPTFNGTIDIDLTVKSPTPVLWLNGTNLQIAAASFEVGGKKVAARPIAGDDDFVGFSVSPPLPAGPARLHVEYTGSLSLKDDRGLFAQKEGDRWYAITQFESIFARRVFPCFDEPGFKVPWQLTIEAPKDDAVFATSAEVSQREEHAGMKTVAFAPTSPLPSYLVAFAVGPYDTVDAGRSGAKKIPLRIAAPSGRGAHARFAAKVSGETIERLEDYFGTPFPYDKLDQVSIPLPTSFGAMENPGLVTWAQNWIGARPEDESVKFQRTFVEVAMHEFAHQWFGDLVTTAWWDDVWLNESFASWLEGKLVDAWHPEWAHGTTLVGVREEAMASDSLVTARSIRQPIVTSDDIYNAFDEGITYKKGQAVLGMFEHFIGPDTFRKGIRSYIAAHANGNATADDFIAAMSSAAGRDLAPTFKTFLNQPGVPLVTASLVCGAGKPASLELSQERYLPLGANAADPEQWQLPVCVRWPAGGATQRSCTLMTTPKATVPLSGVDGCPAWVLANDEAVGYYRVAYQGDLTARLLGDARPLSLAETLATFDDTIALVHSGKMAVADAMALLPGLAADPHREVLAQAIAFVENLRGDLVPDKLRPRYAQMVRKLFAARARKLGWGRAGQSDDDETRLLRPGLLAIAADDGEDRDLRARAVELTRRWLTDRKVVDSDLVVSLLSTAARAGDQALFDSLKGELRRATERRDRGRLFTALGSFTDPRLAQAADGLLLSDDFDARETAQILFAQSQRPETRGVAWTFVKKNFDTLEKRWPPEVLAYLPYIGAALCDREHQTEMQEFFKDRSPKMPGGPRILAQAVEGASVCLAYKNAQAESAARFLAKVL